MHKPDVDKINHSKSIIQQFRAMVTIKMFKKKNATVKPATNLVNVVIKANIAVYCKNQIISMLETTNWTHVGSWRQLVRFYTLVKLAPSILAIILSPIHYFGAEFLLINGGKNNHCYYRNKIIWPLNWVGPALYQPHPVM